MLIRPQILAAGYRSTRARIDAAAARAGRNAHCITLLAVSKGHSHKDIAHVAALGVRDVGESYPQEALPKIVALRGLPLAWHFIGRLQANKTRVVAENFDWVHTVDRPNVVERLAAQRPAAAAPLNVCLQVRLGDLDADARAGAPPGEIAALARAVGQQPRLRLRGLMCLPPQSEDFASQCAWFAQVRALRDQLAADGIAGLDTLSMGMSGDLEAAVAEGSTLLRIGTAIFGARPGAGGRAGAASTMTG
jgi:pyridoxal phosphate enzyme (YggS family)